MDSYDQAKLLRDTALENLDNFRLTPIPDNYRLWFEYAAGSVDSLSSAIDTLITGPQAVNDKICKQLYLEHLANGDQRDLDETRLAIGEMLEVMLGHIRSWSDTSDSFYNRLEEQVSRLDKNPSVRDIRSIICSITEEVRTIQESNRDITTTLNSLSSEISELRQDVDRLGSEALTDSLTMVANRRGFDQYLREAIDEAQSSDSPCALLVADIDDFKTVNDTFGHLVGDKILKFVAATLSRNIRGNDILARYGGEEFTIILPNTDHRGAMRVAENLRREISSRQLTTGSNGQLIGRITLSLGVSTYRQGDSPETFFDRTDRLMYRAKQDGKNRVVGEDG